MASKKLTSSGGYFNKEMLTILNKGEKKASSNKKTSKSGSKRK